MSKHHKLFSPIKWAVGLLMFTVGLLIHPDHSFVEFCRDWRDKHQ